MNFSDYEYFALPLALAPDEASPDWNNKADNGWQLTAATMVGLQSVPGLVILYGSMVKKKWAVNSAFMALYAFAAVLICWVLWAHHMSFGTRISPIMGKPNFALSPNYLLLKTKIGFMPMADFVFFQFAFAALSVILLGGSLLGRMNFYAWMLFVPLWLTFSYTIGAFTIWGDGFLEKGIIDYAGGYVIHLSSGVAGFTAAYWVGPRHSHDRQHFPPNNIIHMLGGAGFLWLGWTGFNGGSPFAAGLIAPIAILNTHVCTATSLMIWVSFDMIVYKKSSVIGAVQGMITGLVCITPGAGVVDSWAAILMGMSSGSLTWYSMMVVHRRAALFQSVDDTLGVFHTHAVAGVLGGILSGLLANPRLVKLMYPASTYGTGLFYSFKDGKLDDGLKQMGYQLLGIAFVTAWNVVMTSFICIFISRFVNLRMDEEDLLKGDDAVHGEEAYALWGDGERILKPKRLHRPRIHKLLR
ncbi:ammonium transporter 3 member 1-like [Tripterygium wilfordii]|uniref:Ammonium transporter n=2 Tax=Tripterygium wilfordii TaxID=458696 RepID=A0A7J7CVK7_TRIWF|nr:ammonium transporter 3 member 1-like [Tripterygium wilfordii]